jgi:hypothetical protein
MTVKHGSWRYLTWQQAAHNTESRGRSLTSNGRNRRSSKPWLPDGGRRAYGRCHFGCHLERLRRFARRRTCDLGIRSTLSDLSVLAHSGRLRPCWRRGVCGLGLFRCVVATLFAAIGIRERCFLFRKRMQCLCVPELAVSRVPSLVVGRLEVRRNFGEQAALPDRPKRAERGGKPARGSARCSGDPRCRKLGVNPLSSKT